jgi:hypothetical protein
MFFVSGAIPKMGKAEPPGSVFGGVIGPVNPKTHLRCSAVPAELCPTALWPEASAQ